MNRTNLEYRMYFLVLGSLQGINKGIQCGHAALEYVDEYGSNDDYRDFFENDKTFIMLNGGTSNNGFDEDGKFLGSLNMIADELNSNNINFAMFYEPDINNALTAVCFLADERVYNKFIYPDYDSDNFTSYEQWLSDIGGTKNFILREILDGKKLAS